MTATKDKNLAKLFSQIEAEVRTEWGPAFGLLGARLQRALLAERVMAFAVRQDDEFVSDESVRLIVNEGWVWAVDKAQW